MPIRFHCPQCKKKLGVKDELAGRRAKCPACKAAIVIPAPVAAAADLEELAASVLGDPPAKEEVKPAAPTQTIKFACSFCDAEMEVPLSEAGKKIPCIECRRIVRVPVPNEDKPKDWRNVGQKGPSGALINQPEQPADAWSSEQKKKVSQQSLLEAGVIQIDDAEKPVGVRGWIVRGIWTTAILGIGILVIANVKHGVAVKHKKDAIAEFLALLHAKGPKGPQLALDPLWSAEVHRVAGELYTNQRKAAKAREEFKIAMMQAHQGASVKDASPVDGDLFLTNLALAQFELGGGEQEAIDKERLDWRDVIADLTQTLTNIRSLEARMQAMRLVGTRLLSKNDPKLAGMAVGLAGSLSETNVQLGQPSMKAPQVALLLARNDVKEAEKIIAAPNVDKGPVDYLPRIAYAEGWARQRKDDAAFRVAVYGKDAKPRIDACIAAATAILGDASRPSSAQDAKRFVAAGLESVGPKEKLSPWALFHLLLLARRTDSPEPKELVQRLDHHFLAHARLERIRSTIEKKSEFVASIEDEEALKDYLPRALAWEALARHNTRLGFRENCLRLVSDEKLKPVLLAGIALGEQDKRK